MHLKPCLLRLQCEELLPGKMGPPEAGGGGATVRHPTLPMSRHLQTLRGVTLQELDITLLPFTTVVLEQYVPDPLTQFLAVR